MNILGEGFPKEIIEQVKQRQKIYGSGYDGTSRSNEELIYLNANTAWCKLVSSTYIDNINIINNDSIRTLGLEGDQLARQFILFNGTYTSGSDQRSGINLNIFDPSGGNGAYGIGGKEFGINPMMGIQSAIINHKNRGSIRTATVNIKAWNKLQFEIIDILYLRLGFSVLLEWGHSIYYTSPVSGNPGFTSNPTNNSLTYDFLDGNISYKEFLNKIQKKRLETFGNYDAMFGKVTNFHWSFKPDGSYDIVLNLVSVGDVVESFKIKGNAPTSIKTNNQATPNLPTLEEELSKYAQSSELANYLYKCTLALKSYKNSNLSCFLYNTAYDTDWDKYWDSNGTFALATNNTSSNKDVCVIVPPGGNLGVPNLYPLAPTPLVQTPSANIGNPYYPIAQNQPTATSVSNYYLGSNANSSSPIQNYYFIRLGNLLKFIEEGIMYKLKSSNSQDSTPILNFDYETNTNLMHVPPQLMGYDPRLAMVKTSVEFPGGSGGPVIPSRIYFNKTNTNATEFANDFIDSSNNNAELGRIMNVYVNFQFILDKLKELSDKDTNEVSLIDFLKNILAGINSSFGGYSKLDIFIDETTNTLKIIDQNPLPSLNQTIDYINSLNIGSLNKDLAYFDLYGYNTSPTSTTTAGFIKEFNFTTELTPEFSTMISVAATSNGNVVGENNTALSRLNKGLYDKYKKEINGGGTTQQTASPSAPSTQQILKTNYDAALKEFEDYAKGFKTYANHLFEGNYLNDEINDYKDSITIYFKLWKKFKKTANDYFNYDPNNSIVTEIDTVQFQPGTGFIPFNLSLKMNGLSGIKIGSRFLIDTAYLPSNYPTTVDFLIKNLSHEIKDNTWTTSLESYCIAKGPESYKPTPVLTPTPSPSPSPTPIPTTPGNRSKCAIKNIPTTPKYISASSVSTYFKAKGYSKAAIAGILGNIQAESALNMNAFNPAGGGCGAYGLVQWRGSRQTGLYNYSKALSQPIDAFFVQLGYMYQEIESSQVRRIKTLSDPREAAYIFASEFERFTNSSNRNNPEVIKRQNFASQFINQI